MAASEQFTAHLGIFQQSKALQICDFNICLMVIQLAHQILAIRNRRPTKKWIGEKLHGALPIRNTLSLVMRSMIFKIFRVARSRFFFDLEEERIAPSIALKVHKIIAQSDRPRAHHLKSHVDGPVLCEEVLSLRQKVLFILMERSKNGARLPRRNACQQRLVLSEDPPARFCPSAHLRNRKLLQRVRWG